MQVCTYFQVLETPLALQGGNELKNIKNSLEEYESQIRLHKSLGPIAGRLPIQIQRPR